jgi:hypothetical protein
MSKHPIGTRKEWLAKRLELLAAEKEATRRSDELAKQPEKRGSRSQRASPETTEPPRPRPLPRRSQPWSTTMYARRRPLPVVLGDRGFNGIAVHLANHDVSAHGRPRAAQAVAGVQEAMERTSLWAPVRRRLQPRLNVWR